MSDFYHRFRAEVAAGGAVDEAVDHALHRGGDRGHVDHRAAAGGDHRRQEPALWVRGVTPKSQRWGPRQVGQAARTKIDFACGAGDGIAPAPQG